MSRYRATGNTNRTLTDAQVMQFRADYHAKPSRVTTREIMEQTELSMVSVRRMLNAETYRHIGMAPLDKVKQGDAEGDAELRASEARMAAWIRANHPNALVKADAEQAKQTMGGLTSSQANEPSAEEMLDELYGTTDTGDTTPGAATKPGNGVSVK